MFGESASEQHQRCLETLKAHVRRHPMSVREIERRLGYSPSYLHRILRGKVGLSFEGLLQLLEVVDMSFEELAIKTARVDAEGLLERALPPGTVDPPEIEQLSLVATQLIEGDLVRTAPDSACQALFQAVSEADEQRYSDPWLAAEKAWSIAACVAPRIAGRSALELCCGAISVYGSCCRIGGAAQHAIRALISVSQLVRSCGLSHRADWLLRAASALNSHGEHEAGLELGIVAGEIFERLGDSAGVGSALISKAISMVFLKDNERAATTFHSALLHIPSKGYSRRLMAAHHGLAKLLVEQGDLEEARSHIVSASSEVQASDTYSRGMLARTMGNWHWKKGHREEAIEDLRSAEKCLVEINPFDTAFVVLDQIGFCLEIGRLQEAIKAAEETSDLIELFKSNPMAGGILLRLRDAAQRGRLSMRLIEIARRRMAGRRPFGIRPPATFN